MAVALVVLFHAGVPGVRGGYVGVDVFFVISGFVITGLLLRERAASGRTSVVQFYARRCRRILPAATVVIVATVILGHLLLGPVSGSSVAGDGRWAALFLANFHFMAIGTNYFSTQALPSPLQHYWSLAVEEQFYLVYPTVLIVIAGAGRRARLRARLTGVLAVVTTLSFALSVVQTSSNQTVAYFSPFTRAWELALGALIALATPRIARLPSAVASCVGWLGLAAIVVSAMVFTNHSAYPGSLVALPVLGAGLVIAAGTARPRRGVETLLGRASFRWLGQRSYSLYLWHWPVLVLAAERTGKVALPVADNLLLIGVAIVLAAASYSFVENPIRRARLTPGRSILGGASLVLTAVVVSMLFLGSGAPASVTGRIPAAADSQVVTREVDAARHIASVSSSIRRAHYGADYFQGESTIPLRCWAGFSAASVPICPFGDQSSSRLMVLYGDSHALMWVPAFRALANASHWRLVLFAKVGCPATWVDNPQYHCVQWHRWVSGWINRAKPDVLVISQSDLQTVPGPTASEPISYSTAQWHAGLDELFRSFRVPSMRTVLLGTTPVPTQPTPGCLGAHPSDVQACWTPVSAAIPSFSSVDRSTALADGVQFVDTTPWFCSSVCTPIIGDYVVYDDWSQHISGPWVSYLRVVLRQSLQSAMQ